ncbi:hypothetical protein [Fulvivirga maritima]|uniref:hypothetical protein n=1 Tax=Fulvivirga maritima TaxID=2904247 RepID=UPI002795C1C2|nr:hypothetical protein [Fulvivirga maritima]
MSENKGNFFMSMCIIGTLFFTIGFATWVNGTLIPYLQIACQLETEIQSYLVATAFYIAYTLMALPSSYLLGKVGYKKGDVIVISSDGYRCHYICARRYGTEF